MAKKIIISFNSQPTLALFLYSIPINNVKIIYTVGVDTVDTSYANTATTMQQLSYSLL
jgi:hypothetical protein